MLRKAGGEVGSVERALQRLREHALVDHVLNGKEAGDVRLCFLERAVGFLQLFAHGRFAAVHRDVVRTETVHQLVHHDVGEKGIERQVFLVVRRKDHLRDRDKRLGEFRILHVLEHDALRAFLARDPFVVRQIKGGGLDAMVGVARTEDFIDHDHRRKGADLRVAIFRVDREMVLDVLELAGKFLQLRAFRFVLDGDEGLEAGFVIEPFVFVNLVGPDRRLDRAFQFHPGNVARVIIVAQESVSAGGEEFLQGRLGRGRGGFAQEDGGAGQLAFVFDVVGNEGELPVRLADGQP